MVPFGRVLKAAAGVMVLATATVMVLEILELSHGGSGRGKSGAGRDGAPLQRREDIMINPVTLLPNEWRVKTEDGVRVAELSDDIGTRSVHNGVHQRERQLWLETRAKDIREGRTGTGSSKSVNEESGSNASSDGGAQGRESGSSAATARAADDGGGGGHDEKEEGTAAAATAATTQIGTAEEARSSASAAADEIREGDETATGGGEAAVNGGDGNDVRGSRRRARSSRSSSSGPSRSLQRGRGGDVHQENDVAPGGPGVGRGGRGGEKKQPLEGGKGVGGFRALGDEPPPGQGDMEGGEVAAFEPLPLEERLGRLETGVELWGATYVPPIAPEEMRRLTDKWTAVGAVSGAAAAAAARGDSNKDNNTSTTATPDQVEAPSILFVVTSFDRGRRLGLRGKGVDKLDYVLMIMDEIRGACEAGFSPHVHLISAWEAQPELELFTDRLLCRRIGGPVTLTLEEHPPSIKEALSIKHRIYMKPRVREYDLFVQLEDDMILTVNHILTYLEESEKLSLRNIGTRPRAMPMHDFMPGFVRVEPEPGATGVGGEWFEWEIILSRFRGVHVVGAGTYLGLEKSRVMPFSGNNQGFWMATQEQLKYLCRQCQYLIYTDQSSVPFVEKFSGSLEMFSPPCHATKVFPAERFENFLVHHRTNNKNGKRGESTPAVSVSMLRLWAAQVVRDDEMLMEVGQTGRR